MVAEGRALVRPDDPGTAYVTREDCAAAAAAALTTPGHENRIYEVTGPALVRGRDLAEAATAVSGVAIEVVEATPEQAAALPELPPSGATLSTHFRDLTGRDGTTARQLLESNREALLAARAR